MEIKKPTPFYLYGERSRFRSPGVYIQDVDIQDVDMSVITLHEFQRDWLNLISQNIIGVSSRAADLSDIDRYYANLPTIM